MTPAQRTARLLDLMAQHKLNAPAVAAMLGKQPNTVRVWRSAKVAGKVIPANVLELLELKLAKGTPCQQNASS